MQLAKCLDCNCIVGELYKYIDNSDTVVAQFGGNWQEKNSPRPSLSRCGGCGRRHDGAGGLSGVLDQHRRR